MATLQNLRKAPVTGPTVSTGGGGYQKPAGGIPVTDLDASTQTKINTATNFVVNPTAGWSETTISGNKYAALPTTGNNVRANLTLRTGSVGNLKPVASTNGEVAVVNDQQALFMFKGAADTGVYVGNDFVFDVATIPEGTTSYEINPPIGVSRVVVGEFTGTAPTSLYGLGLNFPAGEQIGRTVEVFYFPSGPDSTLQLSTSACFLEAKTRNAAVFKFDGATANEISIVSLFNVSSNALNFSQMVQLGTEASAVTDSCALGPFSTASAGQSVALGYSAVASVTGEVAYPPTGGLSAYRSNYILGFANAPMGTVRLTPTGVAYNTADKLTFSPKFNIYGYTRVRMTLVAYISRSEFSQDPTEYTRTVREFDIVGGTVYNDTVKPVADFVSAGPVTVAITYDKTNADLNARGLVVNVTTPKAGYNIFAELEVVRH